MRSKKSILRRGCHWNVDRSPVAESASALHCVSWSRPVLLHRDGVWLEDKVTAHVDTDSARHVGARLLLATRPGRPLKRPRSTSYPPPRPRPWQLPQPSGRSSLDTRSWSDHAAIYDIARIKHCVLRRRQWDWQPSRQARAPRKPSLGEMEFRSRRASSLLLVLFTLPSPSANRTLLFPVPCARV